MYTSAQVYISHSGAWLPGVVSAKGCLHNQLNPAILGKRRVAVSAAVGGQLKNEWRKVWEVQGTVDQADFMRFAHQTQATKLGLW